MSWCTLWAAYVSVALVFKKSIPPSLSLTRSTHKHLHRFCRHAIIQAHLSEKSTTDAGAIIQAVRLKIFSSLPSSRRIHLMTCCCTETGLALPYVMATSTDAQDIAAEVPQERVQMLQRDLH